MLTLEQAKQLRPGTIIYHNFFKNADGTKKRYKVNGIPQVWDWKTKPTMVRVPLKHGLYHYCQLWQDQLNEFDMEEK